MPRGVTQAEYSARLKLARQAARRVSAAVGVKTPSFKSFSAAGKNRAREYARMGEYLASPSHTVKGARVELQARQERKREKHRQAQARYAAKKRNWPEQARKLRDVYNKWAKEYGLKPAGWGDRDVIDTFGDYLNYMRGIVDASYYYFVDESVLDVDRLRHDTDAARDFSAFTVWRQGLQERRGQKSADSMTADEMRVRAYGNKKARRG